MKVSMFFWTPVEESLPPVGTRVLVVATLAGNRHVGIATITSIRQDGKPKWTGYNDVSHWSYLPELPN